MIYKRFTEKAAEEWRQIYKALQLLEFLVKNGSERVIDDARSHLTLLKMLRQFHHIDQNGKDQGLNVRNRAKELGELLSDVERIRAERKKSRTTRNKYSGVEGGAGLGGSSGASRYGGFSSESASGQRDFGGYSGGVYGDGGGFGGQSNDWQEGGDATTSSSSRQADQFDEYDEFDEGAKPTPRAAGSSRTTTSARRGTERSTAKKPEAPKKKEPEVDLFSFDEPAQVAAPAAIPTSANVLASTDDDDDFDDFQSATPSQATPAATTAAPNYSSFSIPAATQAPQTTSSSNMSAFSSLAPASTATSTSNYSSFTSPPAPKPQAFQSTQPNYFTSVPTPSAPATGNGAQQASSMFTAPAAAKKPSGDAFGSLWSSASVGVTKKAETTKGPALGQLAKEKASAGIWGTGGSNTSTGASSVMGHPTQQKMADPAVAKTGKEPKWMDDLLG